MYYSINLILKDQIHRYKLFRYLYSSLINIWKLSSLVIFKCMIYFFFSDALITPDSSSAFAKELHKRLIDNVKEYMERKRERIDVSDNTKKLKSS